MRAHVLTKKKKIQKLRRAITIALILLAPVTLSIFMGIKLIKSHIEASDEHVRDAVVLLTGVQGSCTGVSIETSAGKHYVLTAAHCSVLLDSEGQVTATNEQGVKDVLTKVQQDEDSDLLLLTSSSIFGSIKVSGTTLELHQHVHALTHGGGAPTYRTDGEVLDNFTGKIPVGMVLTKEEEAKCLSEKQHEIVPSFFGSMCVLSLNAVRATAKAIPGSSGGPLVDESGRLVGIASFIDGNFSYYVQQNDILKFLAKAAR